MHSVLIRDGFLVDGTGADGLIGDLLIKNGCIVSVGTVNGSADEMIHADGRVVCPGFIDTDMTRGVPENVWQIMINKIPAGYAGEAKDVGECVAFLASDGARYINGEVINVGGGMVL